MTSITISMPYYGCAATVTRAVESVLSQSHTDLTLVVVNDGDPEPPWPLLADIDDPRLIRFELGGNRGRYFVDAVVLRATASPWLLVHDADDWCDADLVGTYLSTAIDQDADVVFGAHVIHRDDGRPPAVLGFRDVLGPATDEPTDVAPHQALFRTDLLRGIGGYYGGLRIGFDTLLVNLVRMAGRVAYVETPLYHRVTREGSLTSSPETGFGSPARRRAADEIGRIYAEVRAAHRAGAPFAEPAGLKKAMATAVGRRVTDEERQQLDVKAAELRSRLESAPVPVSASTASLLDRPDLFQGGWAIHRELAAELVYRLQSRRPRAVLEVGSGDSTVVLAAYAAKSGARVVTLEHDPGFADHTRRRLCAEGLQDQVELVVAPLAPFRCGAAGDFPWYRHDLTGSFDFALIDGPPMRYGRQAALFAIAPHLAEEWEAWLDDAERSHEQSCLRLWCRSLGVSVREVPLCGKRLAIVSRSPVAAEEQALDGVLICLDAVGGPGALNEWARAADAGAPGWLEGSRVMAAAYDLDTLRVLRRCRWIDQVVDGAATGGSVGGALLAAAATDADLLVHVSSEWTPASAAPDGLRTAEGILRSRPDIGQVRLTHAGERPVTGWTIHDAWAASPSAPFTLDPNLVRRADLSELLPTVAEAGLVQALATTGQGSAALLPGIFHRR